MHTHGHQAQTRNLSTQISSAYFWTQAIGMFVALGVGAIVIGWFL